MKNGQSRIRIARTKTEITRCFAVMAELRPHLIEREFFRRIRRQQRQGRYELAFLEDAGAVRAVAGFRVAECLWSGKFFYVDDLVTASGANFLGTTDNQPLEIKANGACALRLEPHSAGRSSLIGGYSQNSAAGAAGAAIAGGGTSGAINSVLGNYGFVGAGIGARAGGQAAVVGGAYNSALGQYSFVGTGLDNTNLGNASVIGGGSKNLVMGPWAHGGWGRGDGDKLGDINFRAKTAEFYREKIELPFFRHFLKGDTNYTPTEAHVFETGTHQWRRFDAWPPKQAAPRTLYFRAGGALGFDAPGSAKDAFDEYVSDPAKPVPYTLEHTTGYPRSYPVHDQRFAASRPDVLVYETEPLEEDLTFAGPLKATLHVSTTGTDADWVIKLIDVYAGDFPDPNPNPAHVAMGGYQQLVRGDVFRGKFRHSFEKPDPFKPGEVAKIEFEIPDIFHTFRRGHRVMVHVQSSWFPLVDRNPQTFVNIPTAKPEDFKKATHRVYRGGGTASSLSVQVLPTGGK
jgi:hypothetical protein